MLNMSELCMVIEKVSPPLHLLYYVSFNVVICSAMVRHVFPPKGSFLLNMLFYSFMNILEMWLSSCYCKCYIVGGSPCHCRTVNNFTILKYLCTIYLPDGCCI